MAKAGQSGSTRVGAWARAWVVLGAAVFALLLGWAYDTDVSPAFRYMGYTTGPVDPVLATGLLGVALLPSLWLPVRLDRPSQVVHWILYLLVVLPTALIPVRVGNDIAIGHMGLALVMVGALGILSLFDLAPLPRFSPARTTTRLSLATALVMVALGLYAVVLATHGLPRIGTLRSLDAVYDVRLDFTDSVTTKGRLAGYAIGWLAQVINPMLMFWGYTRRAPSLILAGVLGQLVLFTITAHKVYLLSPILVPFFAFAARDRDSRFGVWVLWGSVAGIVASAILMRFGSGLLNSFLVRRMFVTPGFLTGHYFEFFTHNPHALLAHSFLRGLVQDVYSAAPATIIGHTYFGFRAHANANVWADAFANFGYLGILAFTLVLGAILRVYDGLARGKDLAFTAFLLGLPAISLANTGLFTALLSHGMALALLAPLALPAVRHERPPPAPS